MKLRITLRCLAIKVFFFKKKIKYLNHFVTFCVLVVFLSSEGESSRDSKTEDIVKLPENLPIDILEIIGNIKQAASTSWEGKVKFFTGPVNNMLLRCFHYNYFIMFYN